MQKDLEEKTGLIHHYEKQLNLLEKQVAARGSF